MGNSPFQQGDDSPSLAGHRGPPQPPADEGRAHHPPPPWVPPFSDPVGASAPPEGTGGDASNVRQRQLREYQREDQQDATPKEEEMVGRRKEDADDVAEGGGRRDGAEDPAAPPCWHEVIIKCMVHPIDGR